MNLRLLSPILLGLALGAAIRAQDITPAPTSGQNNSAGNGGGYGGGSNGGNGQRGGGRGGMGGGMMGRGIEGTVTEVAADHYTIKTYTGELYTIHYSANTRFLKQPPGGAGRGQGGGQGGYQGRGQGGGGGMNRMLPIKSTDVKVGDAVAAAGQIDATAKSVGAVAVVEMDPARAKELQQLEANYGKTWLQGKVTAINDTSVTIMGSVDNAAHTFMADENTVFRKQRDPVTLADIQVGDMVRVEGASSDAGFTATTVNVMPAQGNGPAMRRNAPPPQ
jgi:hypothetical protein